MEVLSFVLSLKVKSETLNYKYIGNLNKLPCLDLHEIINYVWTNGTKPVALT